MAIPPRVSPLKEADLLIPDGDLKGEQIRQVFRRLFAQLNPFFDGVMQLGSSGSTLSQNERVDLVTANFTHGVPSQVRLRKISKARSVIIRSISGATPIGTPSVRMQPLAFVGAPPVALVTIFFTNPGATNVSAMVELREEGIAGAVAPSADSCRANYRNQLASAIANGADINLPFGTQVVDTDNAVAQGPPWAFVVPANKAGLYHCSAAVSIVTPAATAMTLRLQVRVNGAVVAVLQGMQVPAVSAALVTISGGAVVQANVADQIDFTLFQDTAGSINTATSAQLNMGTWCHIVRLLGY